MYSAKIVESSKELSAKERIMAKESASALKLDNVINDEAIRIKVAFWAVIHVESDKSESGEYEKYIVVDSDGVKYCTSSKSFWNKFINMWMELGDESYDTTFVIFKKPSRNYNGKSFITCTIE